MRPKPTRPHLTSFARVACYTGVVWLLVSACGGQSSRGDSAVTGGSGTAGSGTGAAPKYDACETASDCMLDSVGCVCLCDSPDLTEHDFIAFDEPYRASR